MKLHVFALVAVSALVVGCDADEDGLSAGQEKKYGTDPNVVDSDGDGLTDGDEVLVHGSDPAAWDSDGDGYPDGFEIERESDPLDADSWAYEGGWPYNPSADALQEAARSGRSAAVGKTWPRMTLVDQHGDDVDLYHFAQQGVPVIIDIGAEWCGPCNIMSAWISGQYEDQPHPYGYDQAFPNVVANVNAGKVLFLTVVGQDATGEPPAKRVAKTWDDAYPNEHVPVFADSKQVVVDYASVQAWPTMYWLNDAMRIKEEGIEQVLEMIDEL